MRRLALLLAGFGLARLFFWRRPEALAPPPEAEPELDPRAEALRAKLAEGKEIVEEREEFEAGETPVDEADLDERRRRVHEKARAAVEEMSSRERVDDEGA